MDYAPGDEHIINGVPMPRKYIAEMVMDRISASRNYLGDKYDQHQPLEYFMKSKEKLWFIHPKTKRDLEGLLRILNDHGEKVLISYIKNVYLKKDKKELMQNMCQKEQVLKVSFLLIFTCHYSMRCFGIKMPK